MRPLSLCALAATLLAAISIAQFPGSQIPGQPGQYPGGQQGRYPGGGGGSGIPFPRKSSTKKKDTKKQQEEENLRSVSGLLRKNTTKEIVLETEDKRIIRFSAENVKYLKAEKEIKPDQVQPGDHITIDYSQDEDGRNYAARVNFDEAGTAKERAAARIPVDEAPKTFEESGADTKESHEAEPPQKRASAKPPKEEEEEAPSISRNGTFTEVRDAGDREKDSAPKLTRGRQTPRKPVEREEDEPVTAASNRAPVPRPAPLGEDRSTGPTLQRDAPKADPESEVDSFIEKAREVAYTFVDTLPNYTVKQLTTRYVSGQRKNDWQPVDNISIDLVYENGKEQYRNVLLNGKPSKGKAEETGAWSTGEFATVLKDVFSTSTNADFKQLRSSDKISNRDARVYNFYVKQPNSHWHIVAPGESYKPAYRGTIWIDKETHRTMRLEMQSRNVPDAFPIDKVESATDYEFVRLGSGTFLLPVHSESLSCMRGTNQCSRNVIEFRNYKKYGSESNITFQP